MPNFGFDDWMDAQLRNVPLPPNLLTRLSASGPGQSIDDEQIDLALRDVPVPPLLESRLKRIPRRASQIIWRRVALAASLFISIALGTIAYLALIAPSLGPGGQTVVQQPSHGGRDKAQALAGGSANTVAPNELLAKRAKPSTIVPATKDVPAQPAELPLPAGDEMTTVADDVRRAVEDKWHEQMALGAHGSIDRLPDLDRFETAADRGVAPPLVRGYDMLFQLKHGEHPVVVPSANKELAATKMPFTLDTASFDAAIERAQAGQIPPADEIRIEDFLAAQQSLLPVRPPGGLALHVAGSASPFGGELKLLEVAVVAAAYKPQQHQPRLTVVAVDTSAEMRSPARLAGVRRALAKFAESMNDADRVTILQFADKPSTLIEEATRAKLEKFLASDAFAAPSGAADLPQAIEAACDAARVAYALDARQLVLITAQREDLDAALVPECVEKLTRLSELAIPWRIVRLATGENHAQWDELAVEGEGKVLEARNAADIHDALFEGLLGKDPTVASDASLSLTFNAKAVTGYRLLGHEATTLGGPSADPLTIDLSSGQNALGLYELSVRPGNTDPVAYIDLKWTDPFNGQAGRMARPIKAEELAGSFSQAPSWMQAGVIAAKTAESLRGSTFAPQMRPLAQLLELAQQVDARARSKADFQQLVGLLQKTEKLR